MKSTGMIRRIDNLGRIVLPAEIRRSLGIDTKDSIEIYIDNDNIILRKYQPADLFTGSMDDLIDYKGKKISKETIRELMRIADIK